MATASASNSSNFFLYFVIIFCMIQSGISIILALLGIQIQECKINFFQNLNIKLFESPSWWDVIRLWTYLTYFRNKCSGLLPEYGWSNRTTSVQRTYEWMVVYLILGSIWMLISFLLFIVVLGRRNRRGCLRFYFWYSWIIVTMIILCTDLLVSIQYIYDTRYSGFIGYNGICSHGEKFCRMKPYYFYLAPVFMSVTFSRGIVFWILNVILLICVLKQQRTRQTSQKTEEAVATSRKNSDPISTTNVNDSNSLSSLTTLNNNNEPNYVPWVNVLYMPSVYDEANMEKATEHYDEHHYEHVTYPNEITGAINIEIPPSSGNDTWLHGMPSYQKLWTDPGLMKINIGNISVHINRKNTYVHPLPVKYPNMRLVRQPKATKCSDMSCSICSSTDEMHSPY